jgi:hypothetical protein
MADHVIDANRVKTSNVDFGEHTRVRIGQLRDQGHRKTS